VVAALLALAPPAFGRDAVVESFDGTPIVTTSSLLRAWGPASARRR
jgi:hypothetical protein